LESSPESCAMFFMQGGGNPFAGVGPGLGPGMGMPPGFMGMDPGDEDGREAKEVDNSRLYAQLELEPDATENDIKKSYHKLARTHHPDKGGDPETFKAITLAYEVLSDPDRRQRYDKFGEEALEEDGPSGAGPQDLLQQIFGGGGGGGNGKRGGGSKPRTKDVVKPMWVSLENIYNGVTKQQTIARKVISGDGDASACQTCSGRGFIIEMIRMGPVVQQVQEMCFSCNGAGSKCSMRTVPEKLNVFVEKGAPDGHKVTFYEKADESPAADPGNVVIVLKQQEHKVFLRKGADLYIEREISLGEALTGFRVVIQHLDGRNLVVRSNPGEVLQPQGGGTAIKAVKGCGMPIHGDPFNFGNLFLVLKIQFPRTLEPQLADQLRELLVGRSDLHGDDSSLGDDVEEVFVEDIDPLESSKRPTTGEAYDDDDQRGMGQQVQCNQQ